MGNNTEGYAPFDLYPYNPSQPAAFAFVVLFGIVALLHLVAMIPYRCLFPIPLVIGCGLEAAGYYFRSQSHDDVRRTMPFIIQNLLILASPPFLAATIFMSPRRIARFLEFEDLVAMPRLASKLFVVVDVACLATQVAGAIMSGSEDVTQAKQGQTTIQVGLVIQIISFTVFGAIWTGILHRRLRSMDSAARHGLLGHIHWQRYFLTLYGISALFIIRSITRLVEYNQGDTGELISNEAYLYALDATVMLAITVNFLIMHPGRVHFKARRMTIKGYGYPEEEVHLQGGVRPILE